MNKNKIKSLLRPAGFLLLIIVLFAALSRTLFTGGQTLSDYAAENPGLAYGSTPGEGDADDTGGTDGGSADRHGDAGDTGGTDSGSADRYDEADDAGGADGYGDADDTGGADGGSASGYGEAASEDRVTYRSDFYYEPLSEELKERITGISYPAEGAEEITYDDLRFVHVLHYDFDGNPAEGELICSKTIAQDLVEIFYELYLAEYRIERITLIENYEGDDNASMADNNTSCFNYRTVDGTSRLSQHALGLAIDINPFYNPYVRYGDDGGLIVLPEGSEKYADRTADFPYKIDPSDLCYRLFTEHGFTWGGDWNSSKDYQHFQKAAE